MDREPEGSGQTEHVRLSVVLDEALFEHVRRRAYEERKSRSAYVRELVLQDLSRQLRPRTPGQGATK